MELFHKINELRLAAFKAGDKFLHSVLTNVFSDVAPVGTEAAAGVVPTDDQVQAVVKKHLDGVTETLAAIKGKADADVVALKEKEKTILEDLRPAQLTQDCLKKLHEEVQPGSLKEWMAHLKANFTHRYDGKVAKTVFEYAKTDDAAPSSTEPVVAIAQVVDAVAPVVEQVITTTATADEAPVVVAPVVVEAPVGDTFQAPVAADVVQTAPVVVEAASEVIAPVEAAPAAEVTQ